MKHFDQAKIDLNRTWLFDSVLKTNLMAISPKQMSKKAEYLQLHSNENHFFMNFYFWNTFIGGLLVGGFSTFYINLSVLNNILFY